MNFPTKDLPNLLQAILEADGELNAGGVVLHGKVSDPFEHAAPLGVMWTENWHITFRVPKEFPKHWTLNRKSPTTHIDGRTIMFDGNMLAFERDITFAKMLI